MTQRNIPVTILGGSLGVGKTTLLNNLLRNNSHGTLAVLVNDFGKISIDAELISSQTDGVVSLVNGCICCSIGDDLGFALLDIAELDPLPDQIVIETSGIANPARVRDIVTMLPNIEVEATIVLAEIGGLPQHTEDPQVGKLIHDQLKSADLLILNKSDLASKAECRDTKIWLDKIYPNLSIFQTTHAEAPNDLVLGYIETRHIPETSHEHHNHSATGFEHIAFDSEEPLNRQDFCSALTGLPIEIVRGKGFVRFSDRPEISELFQLVGRRWSLKEMDRSKPAGCQLSFIALAENFDRNSFLDHLTSRLT